MFQIALHFQAITEFEGQGGTGGFESSKGDVESSRRDCARCPEEHGGGSKFVKLIPHDFANFTNSALAQGAWRSTGLDGSFHGPLTDRCPASRLRDKLRARRRQLRRWSLGCGQGRAASPRGYGTLRRCARRIWSYLEMETPFAVWGQKDTLPLTLPRHPFDDMHTGRCFSTESSRLSRGFFCKFKSADVHC